jgi:hypothetical protein
MGDPQKTGSRVDPWADDPSLAKSAPVSAPTSGDDDWKIWQQSDANEQPTVAHNLQRAFDEAITPKLHSADQGLMGNIGTGALNVGKGALSLLTPLVHPLDTAKSIFPTEDVRTHNFDPRQDPMVKPFIEHPGEAIEETAGGLLGGKAVGAAGGALNRAMDPLHAYRSSLIPQSEAAARAATDIIKPNPLEYRSMVKNLETNLPNIKEHLQTVGVPKPANPLEFAKGAGGGGQQFSDFYKEHLITPNADAPVGSGTVGSTYARLSDINDKLRPIYRARSMGEQMTKESADHMAALEQERDQLNGNLYKALSERTGLPVEQIQGINKQGAQMQSVGDVTDSAQALRRSGFGGFTPQGVPIPLGPLDKAMKVVDYLRGGSEAVAGRKLARVLNQVQGEPTALPNPEDLATHRMNYQSQLNDAEEANRSTGGTRLQRLLKERTNEAYPMAKTLK